MNKLSEIVAKSLGSENSYAVYTEKSDPSVLNPLPRSLAREELGLTGREFHGFDIWNCHEATFLTDRGLPIAGTLKFVYGCDSEFIIESKSMKVYLNTFDMCRMGGSVDVAIRNYERQVASDLSAALKTEVKAKFFSSCQWNPDSSVNPIEEFDDLMGGDVISPSELNHIEIDDFNGQENHIETCPSGSEMVHKWFSNALRSRCRHTKQKDSGLAAIWHNGPHHISPQSVIKQIASLREVNEFHEFCAEKIFMALDEKLGDQGLDFLCVSLLYSRRGSLDINPVRWTGPAGPDQTAYMNRLQNVNLMLQKTQGQ